MQELAAVDLQFARCWLRVPIRFPVLPGRRKCPIGSLDNSTSDGSQVKYGRFQSCDRNESFAYELPCNLLKTAALAVLRVSDFARGQVLCADGGLERCVELAEFGEVAIGVEED